MKLYEHKIRIESFDYSIYYPIGKHYMLYSSENQYES